MHNQHLDVVIRLTADELLHYYRGQVCDIIVTSVDGRSVRFPMNILRKFVTGDGVQGRFRIRFSDAGKIQGVERI